MDSGIISNRNVNQIETIVVGCIGRKDTSNPSSEDTSEGAVVQRKGRFNVLSADLSPKGPTNCFFGTNCGGLIDPTTPNVTAASLLPSLQSILQQNTIQREEIVKLIKYLEQTSGKQADSTETSASDLLEVSPTTSRERDLLLQLLHLQQSMASLANELQRQKMKNSKLEKRLNALANKDKT